MALRDLAQSSGREAVPWLEGCNVRDGCGAEGSGAAVRTGDMSRSIFDMLILRCQLQCQ